jgi:hypothetical protein
MEGGILRAPAWNRGHAEYRVASLDDRCSRNVARAPVQKSIHMETQCDCRPRRHGNLLFTLPLLSIFFCPVATDITGKSRHIPSVSLPYQ